MNRERVTQGEIDKEGERVKGEKRGRLCVSQKEKYKKRE